MSSEGNRVGFNTEATGEFRRVVERKISDAWLDDCVDLFADIAPPDLTLVVQDSPGVVYVRTSELGEALSVYDVDEAKHNFEIGMDYMVDEGLIAASALESVSLPRKPRFRVQTLKSGGGDHRLTIFPHELYDRAYECGRRLRGEAIASRLNFGNESTLLQAQYYKPPRQVIFATIEGDGDMAYDIADELAAKIDPLVEFDPVELVSFWYAYGENRRPTE